MDGLATTDTVAFVVSGPHSVLALITVPFFTGAIGYLTNWTGVVMLFYPVHFKGLTIAPLRHVVRRLPRRIRQIPGLMVGGIGWQGIVPSRAAKMGSLAVDVGIAKLGTPSEFWAQLEPEKMAQRIVEVTRDDMRGTVDRIMTREHPRLWAELPAQVRATVYAILALVFLLPATQTWDRTESHSRVVAAQGRIFRACGRRRFCYNPSFAFSTATHHLYSSGSLRDEDSTAPGPHRRQAAR